MGAKIPQHKITLAFTKQEFGWIVSALQSVDFPLHREDKDKFLRRLDKRAQKVWGLLESVLTDDQERAYCDEGPYHSGQMETPTSNF